MMKRVCFYLFSALLIIFISSCSSTRSMKKGVSIGNLSESEYMFLTNALTAILGIIATVNGRTAVTGISEVDWGALTGLIIMLAGGGLIGLVIYKYRRIKTNI